MTKAAKPTTTGLNSADPAAVRVVTAVRNALSIPCEAAGPRWTGVEVKDKTGLVAAMAPEAG